MKRQILGVIAATTAAPYLIVLSAILLERNLTPNSPGGDPNPEDFLLFGTVGLLWLGLPLLAVAGTTTAILTRLGWASQRIALLAGAIIGSSFMATLYSGSWTETVTGAMSGAICGWIYWRVAIETGAERMQKAGRKC